jgi:hypothetical protein
MDITISVKQPGRKHALIEKKVITIDDPGHTPALRDLLLAVVKQQVAGYNNKPYEKNLLPFLSGEQQENQLTTGKVGFGSIYNENKANLLQAQNTALQAFEDGLFAVFVNEVEIKKLTDIFSLDSDTVIIFVRLTFLAGSYW